MPDDANAPQDEVENDEGRGDEPGDSGESRPTIKRTRSRRKSSTPTGETKSRNLHLTDDIHDRLWLLARQRRTTVSAVANELLDKALPRWDIKRQA